MNEFEVMAAIHGGVSAVCATCKKYWKGRELGLPGDTCTSKTGCGSPFANDDFHDYEGPMTDFSRFCWVCAGESEHRVRSAVKSRVFGLCAEHVSMMEELEPAESTRLLKVEDLLLKTKYRVVK